MSETAEHLVVLTVSYDCRDSSFHCNPDMGKTLAGCYDDRPFLRILTEDGVASAHDGKEIGALVRRVQAGRGAMREQLHVSLRLKDGMLHPFSARALGEYGPEGGAERVLLLSEEEDGGMPAAE